MAWSASSFVSCGKGAVALHKLNPQHVQRLLNEKSAKLSPQTVGNIKTVLRSARSGVEVGAGVPQQRCAGRRATNPAPTGAAFRCCAGQSVA